MTTTSVKSRLYEVTVFLAVEHAGPRPLPYGAKGQYRPTLLDITYRWSSGDTDQTADVTLRGCQLRKDGSEGQPKRETLWSRGDWPAWVRAAVEDHRPTVVLR